MRHHVYIYNLYCDSPKVPQIVCVEELHSSFRISSEMTLHWWVKIFGPFKGSIQVTSSFPSGCNTLITFQMLICCFSFTSSVADHIIINFADKKPMKDKSIYGRVWRNFRTGLTTTNEVPTACKNRYTN